MVIGGADVKTNFLDTDLHYVTQAGLGLALYHVLVLNYVFSLSRMSAGLQAQAAILTLVFHCSFLEIAAYF